MYFSASAHFRMLTRNDRRDDIEWTRVPKNRRVLFGIMTKKEGFRPISISKMKPTLENRTWVVETNCVQALSLEILKYSIGVVDYIREEAIPCVDVKVWSCLWDTCLRLMEAIKGRKYGDFLLLKVPRWLSWGICSRLPLNKRHESLPPSSKQCQLWPPNSLF